MVDVVADHGYAQASVATVLARAHVSRACFYQHFENREACFRAVYREIAGRMRAAVVEAAAIPELELRPRAVLAACVAEIMADPAAARVLLVEVAGGPENVRLEWEALVASLGREIERYFDELHQGAQLTSPPALALIGGVGGVIVARLIRGDADAEDLLDDLLGWISSYTKQKVPRDPGWEELGRRMAAVAHFPPGRQRQKLLPRGPSSLSNPQAESAQRTRILEATSRVAAAKGYAAVTVGDIARAARVGRGVFYGHFQGKGDAFLQAQTAILQDSMAAAAPAFFGGRSWPERVWAGLAALLLYVISHPEEARLAVLEVHAAGEAAVLHEYENRMAYVQLLRGGYEGPGNRSRPQPVVAEAIAGALYAMVRGKIVEGATNRSLELLPQSAFLVLAPWIGSQAAAAFVSLKAQQGP